MSKSNRQKLMSDKDKKLNQRRQSRKDKKAQ